MKSFNARGSCSCNQVKYDVSGTPMFRAYCHCKICQAFNQSDFADIIVMRSKDVAVTGTNKIAFRYHQQPPLIRRGNCAECGGVAIETIHIPVLPKMTIIPAQTLHNSELAPAPSFHMFYHRRVSEASDELPKHEGYLRSQWAFSTAVLGAFLRKS